MRVDYSLNFKKKKTRILASNVILQRLHILSLGYLIQAGVMTKVKDEPFPCSSMVVCHCACAGI